MKILFLDSAGEGLAFLAQNLLQQFDRYMLVSSASVLPDRGADAVVCHCVSELNLKEEEINFVPVSEFRNEPWDYVITLTEAATANSPVFSGRVKQRIHIPLEALVKEGDKKFFFSRLNDEIKKLLYVFYLHHVLKPEEGQGCPCGANRHCRCF